MAYRTYLDKKQSEKNFEKAASLVVEETPAPETNPTQPASSEPEVPEKELTAYEKYAELYAANPDFVEWLSVEDTRVDYPVMQTKDNPTKPSALTPSKGTELMRLSPYLRPWPIPKQASNMTSLSMPERKQILTAI